MKVLALETTSVACSVALYLDGEIIANHQIAPMQQTKLLLPMIDEILTSNKVKLHQLDAIAFGAGPGSFTGMRIASSVTQGLAFSASLRVVSISSLAAIAQAAHEAAKKADYLVAIDARMGEIYWAHYQVDKNGCVALIGEEKLYKMSETDKIPLADARGSDHIELSRARQQAGLHLSPELTSGQKKPLETLNTIGVGDGWAVYQEKLIEALEFKPSLIDSAQLPTATAVLKLALPSLQQNNTLTATEALPSYLIKR